MSDRAALLAAVLANPDDDAARLVFADYLEENGEAKRAAMIRAQVAEARFIADDSASAVVADYIEDQTHVEGIERIDWRAVDAGVAARLAEGKAHLRRRHASLNARREGLPRLDGVSFGGGSRGFIEHATVEDASEFLAHADAIFRAAPIIDLEFQALTEDEAREFAASGHLARVRNLTLLCEADAVRVLGAHRDAAGVRRLDVFEPADGAAMVESLAAGRHWTGLEHLELSWFSEVVEPGRGQVGEMLARKQFRNLRELSAWECNLDDDAARVVARNMPELRKLNAPLNRIGSAGAVALAESRALPRLRWLDLSSCEIREAGAAAALINSARLPELKVLDLGRNPCRGSLEKELEKPGREPRLRALELDAGQFSVRSLAALARCPATRGLWSLVLRSSLTDEALERFLAAAEFAKLVRLNIVGDQLGNHFTTRGANALAAWPGAASLQWLDISGNTLGESGAKALAASEHLAGLRFIHAGGRGTAALKKRFGKAFG